MDGIWFPAQTETEGGLVRQRSTVPLLSPILWETLLVQRSLFRLDLASQRCTGLMKSAWNPFLLCPLLSDNMMDGPFYSLFHLVCCSKLYFQGAFTWNIHFGVTWLFIREKAQTEQGCWDGSGGQGGGGWMGGEWKPNRTLALLTHPEHRLYQLFDILLLPFVCYCLFGLLVCFAVLGQIK